MPNQNRSVEQQVASRVDPGVPGRASDAVDVLSRMCHVEFTFGPEFHVYPVAGGLILRPWTSSYPCHLSRLKTPGTAGALAGFVRIADTTPGGWVWRCWPP